MMAAVRWVTVLTIAVLTACARPPDAAPSTASAAPAHATGPAVAATPPAGAASAQPAPERRTARVPIAGANAEIDALPSCPDGALFSVIPMDPGHFRAFRPLGFPQLPGHIFGAKHSNFTINLPGEPVVSGRPVRFPSDAWVTEIVSTQSPEGSGFQLTFRPCREFKSYFFHLGSIAPALEAAMKGSSPQCQDFAFGAGGSMRKCASKLLLRVGAGDAVGGSDRFAGVDWGGVDYRVTLPFANRSRYDGDYPHYVSPVLYATPDVRALIEPKLGGFDGKTRRTAEPRTGTLMHDLPGTAQGNWFTPGTSFINTQDFSVWLGLLHDYVDPTLPIVAMGSSVRGLKPGLYAFAPERSGTVHRDFADVRPDGRTYCWDRFLPGPTASGLNVSTAAGALLMTMPNETTLRAEFQAGATCATARPIGAAATTFER